MRFADLSYRVKIPLAITAVILATELVVGALLVYRAFEDARRDLEASAKDLGAVLARSLRDPLVRDDVWQAFEVVRTPISTRTRLTPLQSIVVLGADQRVLVSSAPHEFPMLAAVEKLPAGLRALAADSDAGDDFRFLADKESGEYALAARTQIRAEDGSPLGVILLQYDATRYVDRILSSIAGVALLTVPGLLLLLPLGWWWGNRMAGPLAALAATLGAVGTTPARQLMGGLQESSKDEIGTLSSSARRMLASLAEKEALEKEMVAAERLAAVGRVSAAIAHEINNPLGGMLNSIDTLQAHGRPDSLTTKTLGLLRRGLEQIRATMGALLVEARLDAPDLSTQDWDDLRTLIEPQAKRQTVRLIWDVEVERRLALPAHQVRQLVLNLALNALKASEAQGSVRVSVQNNDAQLTIVVTNTGPTIPADQLPQLFEPFVVASEHDGRRSFGLGLWTCYQIAVQLGGTITATSAEGVTAFTVRLPISQQSLQEAA